ncbi:MAG: DUF4097 family beta strand repeat protein [Ferruginibacter sp.]|nr:DUF4097 family beta strand repeat protein [Cytophagales bacterium]
MKTPKLLFIALLPLLAGSAFTDSPVGRPATGEAYQTRVTFDDDKPYLTKEFTLNGAGNLRVETSGGHIRVKGGSGSEVKVEMYARLNNGRDRDRNEGSVKEELEKYDVSITQEGNTVTAVAKRKSGFRNQNSRLSISFEITAPTRVASNLQTSGGHIQLAGLSGTQEAETSGGHIEAENLKGNLNLHTSGGHITATNLNGNAQLETSGGHIRLAACDGKLDARTSGGHIDANDVSGELKVETSGGGISLKEIRGSVDAHTSGGSIHADVLELGRYLTLRTSGGGIDATIPSGKGLDLDLEGDRVRTTLSNFNGTSEKDRIVGTMNGGGIPVKMSTSGSSVVLNYR